MLVNSNRKLGNFCYKNYKKWESTNKYLFNLSKLRNAFSEISFFLTKKKYLKLLNNEKIKIFSNHKIRAVIIEKTISYSSITSNPTIT